MRARDDSCKVSTVLDQTVDCVHRVKDSDYRENRRPNEPQYEGEPGVTVDSDTTQRSYNREAHRLIKDFASSNESRRAETDEVIETCSSPAILSSNSGRLRADDSGEEACDAHNRSESPNFAGDSDLVADVAPYRGAIENVVRPNGGINEVLEVQHNHPDSHRNRSRVPLKNLPIHRAGVEEYEQSADDDER